MEGQARVIKGMGLAKTACHSKKKKNRKSDTICCQDGKKGGSDVEVGTVSRGRKGMVAPAQLT